MRTTNGAFDPVSFVCLGKLGVGNKIFGGFLCREVWPFALSAYSPVDLIGDVCLSLGIVAVILSFLFRCAEADLH